MRTAFCGLAIAAALSLAACGSSSHADKPSQPMFTSAQDVADKADLKSCVSSDTGHDFVDEVTCGDRAIVTLFDASDQRAQWLKNYLVNGLPTGAAVLYDGRWAIACEQASTCSEIQNSMGGTLKP